jgi:hypothetical protein
MNSLPDPSFFLQLSESFIKTAKLVGGDQPRLLAIREISSAELVTQSNPIIQLADEGQALPIPVATTLSLGESVYVSHSFAQVGFSTLSEFIKQEGPNELNHFELGVFDRVNGLPAPTASPVPMDLVFCGFNSTAIPEISEAFPNLDASPTSISLAVLDLFRFLKSQCKADETILLIEIGNERTHLFLIGSDGLQGIQTVDIGRHQLYMSMAELLHLHYIGSAVKLFTRSGFDAAELAPRLGALFGSAIRSSLETAQWFPTSVHLTGLISAQNWFLEAVLKDLELKSFVLDQGLLPFEVDEGAGEVRSSDLEIIAKIYTSLSSDEDYSWQNDYLSCLSKSDSIPRRPQTGSNPPFPTAHPEDFSNVVAMPAAKTIPQDEVPISNPSPEYSPYAPQADPEESQSTPLPSNQSPRKKEVEEIPAYLLRDVEEYESEFEENDDFGDSKGRMAFKLGILVFSLILAFVLVIIVFYPEVSEKYLGLSPPKNNFEQPVASRGDATSAGTNELTSSIDPPVADVETLSEQLRAERANSSFGGLFLPTNPTGATVTIGDLSPLTSPVKLPNLRPGTYDVTVSKEGFKTEIITVTIEPKQVLKTETVHLLPEI